MVTRRRPKPSKSKAPSFYVPSTNIDPRTLRVPGSVQTPSPVSEQKEETKESNPEPHPELINPFKAYSLLGHSAELEAFAMELRPLMGSFVHAGQSSMIYAEPGTGKTLTAIKLILDAVEKGWADPDKVFYVNADDNSKGIVTKNTILSSAGIHMLVPGHKNMTTGKVAEMLQMATDNGTAKGCVVIIDTMKKFTDLMDKKRTAQFAQLCRAFVAKGGTIIALGHTAKNPNADGSPRYQGTTDILEDFDAVYVGQALSPKKKDRQIKGVLFTRKKSRADSPETVCYAFSTEEGISYEEKLASLSFIEGEDVEDYVLDREKFSDPVVMEAITALIQENMTHGKMALAKAAATRARVSVKAAVEVLDRYTGTTPREHLWTFHKGERGVQIYTLIDQ